MDANNFNNFFQSAMWASSKNMLHARGEITSSDKNTMPTGQSSSSSILAPSKLTSNHAQPPHSTNLSIENRSYLDLRHHHQQQQQQQQQQIHQQLQSRQNSFSNNGMTILPANGSNGSSRDSNNNGLTSQSINFSNNQKLLNRLDMDTIRGNNSNNNIGNVNSRNIANLSNSSSNLMHHHHGTILFNTLNGGGSLATANLLSGANSDCFGNDFVDSTTPPPNAITMPPTASSASSSSSTISTNIGLNRNSNSSNGSQDGNPEKVKTPNSIRGKQHAVTMLS
jgi:hypothetical protein